jgi:hypothetical protein
VFSAICFRNHKFCNNYILLRKPWYVKIKNFVIQVRTLNICINPADVAILHNNELIRNDCIVNLDHQQKLFLKSLNVHWRYNKNPCAGKATLSTGPFGTLYDLTRLITPLTISILNVLEVFYNKALALKVKHVVSERWYPVHNCSARIQVL